MKLENLEGGQGGGDGDRVCDGEIEVFESIILYLAILDAWIMPVLKFMMSEKFCGGHMQKICVETFQKVFPISSWQFSKEQYNSVKEWEPDDVNMSTAGEIEATRNADEAKLRVFRTSCNACVTKYVPTGSYLAILTAQFSEYVGDEQGKINHGYIAQFSEDYSRLKNIWKQGVKVGNATDNQYLY